MAVNTANAQVAYQYFLGKGLTPAQAAGIVGNLQAESGLRPEAVNSIGCVGIAQWCGGRRQPGIQTGDNARDLQTQLDLIWHELNGPEHRALTLLQATSSPGQAALAFEAGFERSGGAILKKRQDFANEVASLAGSWPTTPTAMTAGGGGGPSVLQSVENVAFNLPNPLNLIPGFKEVVGTASFLSNIWKVLTDRIFWLRIGQLLLGGLLLIFGVVFMTAETKAGKAIVNTAAVAV